MATSLMAQQVIAKGRMVRVEPSSWQGNSPDGLLGSVFSGRRQLNLQGIVLVLHLLVMLNALVNIVLPYNQPEQLSILTAEEERPPTLTSPGQRCCVALQASTGSNCIPSTQGIGLLGETFLTAHSHTSSRMHVNIAKMVDKEQKHLYCLTQKLQQTLPCFQ